MAWAYLEAEEWNVTEALTSLLGDRADLMSTQADREQAIFAYDAETSRLRRAGLLNIEQFRARVLALGELIAEFDRAALTS